LTNDLTRVVRAIGDPPFHAQKAEQLLVIVQHVEQFELYLARLPTGFIIRNENPTSGPGELPIVSTR